MDLTSTTASWQLAINEISCPGAALRKRRHFHLWTVGLCPDAHFSSRNLFVDACCLDRDFDSVFLGCLVDRDQPIQVMDGIGVVRRTGRGRQLLLRTGDGVFDFEPVAPVSSLLFQPNCCKDDAHAVSRDGGSALPELPAKFSHQILALAIVGIIALDNIRRRQVPWVLLVYAISVPAFWLLCGQRLGLFWPYLYSSLQLSSTYSEAMALTPPNAVWATGIFVLCSIFLFIQAWKQKWTNEQVRRFLFLAGLMLVLFLTLKAGHVRADKPHIVASFSMLAAVAMIFYAIFGNVPFSRILTAAGVLLAFFLLCNAMTVGSFHAKGEGVYDQCLASLRSANPLPLSTESVDAYPGNQALLIANRLPLRPRPVLQSYIATTHDLADANASHLTGGSAPQSILFAIQPLDNRYPSFDDSLSWLPLLNDYRSSGIVGGFLIFKKRSTPVNLRLIPISDSTSTVGQQITIPANEAGPIWAEIDLPKTTAGSLAMILFKAPELTMRANLS